jgi:multiple sugar transport system permease protein
LLPFIIVPIVGTLMFKQLFEPSGLFTYLYQELLDTKFRYTEASVKTLIVLYGIWYVTPFSFVVYFAGLQTLSKDQIEAASIDGATRWQKIQHIVVPHLQSLTILILLFSIMDTYRVFDSVFVLSELNPIYKADTVMTYTFQTAITVQRLGKANAMAILTVVGIMIVLIPNLIQAYRQQIEER